jgi:hypothetical protein
MFYLIRFNGQKRVQNEEPETRTGLRATKEGSERLTGCLSLSSCYDDVGEYGCGRGTGRGTL